MATERQYKEKIIKLEKEREEDKFTISRLEDDIRSRDVRIAELSRADIELADQKKELRESIFTQYKINRGAYLTGEELTRYEKRINDMDIWNLQQELQLVKGVAKSITIEKEEEIADFLEEEGVDEEETDEEDEEGEKRAKSKVKAGRKSKSDPKNAQIKKTLEDPSRGQPAVY